MGQTVEQAMRQAAEGSDWATLAELIETARLQLGPREGEDLTNGAMAPFVRVRGISQLEQALWYQPGEQAPSYDLERLAEVVLGPDTWWWSTWVVGTELYWALIPPQGTISGGVLPIGRGTPLGDALFDLRDASPIPYPGESIGGEQFAERMDHSPLFGPLLAESALAAKLAQLLPQPLRDQLMSTSESINLAIAPARALANVPWSIVGIGTTSTDIRLIERCRLAIAPPAGLLAALSQRPRYDGASPLSLAVLNPGGALGAPGDDLLSASALIHFIPAGTRTVCATDNLTVLEFGEILRSLAPESSVVFACHTHGGTGVPLSGGIQLRPATPADPVPVVLSAADLIDSPDCFPIPSQGLILACDSADLGQATDGEWLVLGPALLWAGAQRLVVTGFPVVDSSSVDQPLIAHLLAGDNLVDSLRAIQVQRLGQWRSTAEEDLAPAIWSAHVALGAFTPAGTVTAVNTVGGRYVEEDFVRALDSAARHAATMGRSTVTPKDVLYELAIYGFYENMPFGRRLVVQTCAYAWNLASLVVARLHQPALAGASVLSPATMDLVTKACTIAASARHRVLDVEHLLVAVLAGPAGLPSIARWLSHWDGRHPEAVKEMIGETQDGYHTLGRPKIKHLAPQVVRAIYVAFSVELPEAGDRTLVLLDDI